MFIFSERVEGFQWNFQEHVTYDNIKIHKKTGLHRFAGVNLNPLSRFRVNIYYFHLVYLTISSYEYHFFFLKLFNLLTWFLSLLSLKSSGSFHLISEILATHIVRLTIWHQLFLEFWLFDTCFFAHSRDQCAVTHLKNVHQLNKRRGEKSGFQSQIDNLYILTHFWMLSMVVTVFETEFTLWKTLIIYMV